MFRRRTKRSIKRKALDFLWPEIGLRRWSKYWWHRLCRITATPHVIAKGVACGVTISFTPLIGFHVLAGIGLAYLLRGNLLAAAIGTLVGNPFTLPIFLSWQFMISSWIIGPSQAQLLSHLKISEVFTNPLVVAQSWMDTVLYGLVGAIPLSLTMGLLSYWITRHIVIKYQSLEK